MFSSLSSRVSSVHLAPIRNTGSSTGRDTPRRVMGSRKNREQEEYPRGPKHLKQKTKPSKSPQAKKPLLALKSPLLPLYPASLSQPGRLRGRKEGESTALLPVPGEGIAPRPPWHCGPHSQLPEAAWPFPSIRDAVRVDGEEWGAQCTQGLPS